MNLFVLKRWGMNRGCSGFYLGYVYPGEEKNKITVPAGISLT
jgi:hypothetical protein